MNIFEHVVEKVIVEQSRRSQSDRYFNHPDLWAKEMLGEDEGTFWSKQTEVAESVVKNKNTSVKAGHGVGKSRLVAVLICWWIDTRAPDVFVASTAPSQKQIGAIVWREVRAIKDLIERRHKEGLVSHVLPGYITADNEWKMPGGTILGFGRKPPDNKEDDSFQGIHAEYVLSVGDEAIGLSEDMIDALGNITSNENSRRILIANPTNPGSHFAKIFKENTGAWSLHTISVLDSPNFTDEKYKMPKKALDKLTGTQYVEDKKLEYGEDTPRYKARVLGEFAWDMGDTLIKPEHIAVAYDTDFIVLEEAPIILGCDIARFGKDYNVIYKQESGQVRHYESWSHQTRLTEVAARIHKAALDTHASEVRIDGAGIGGGVVDILLSYDPKDVPYTIIAMNPAGASPDRKKWHNARAYWWDKFRLDLIEGHIDLDNKDEHAEKLEDELLSVEYKFNAMSAGLVIESKDDMRKRGQKSPDYADAAIMAAADMEYLFNDAPKPGDKLYEAPESIIGQMPSYLELMESPWGNGW